MEKFNFFLIFFILRENLFLCRKKVDSADLGTIVPIFEKIETEPTNTFTYVKFQVMENYNYEINYNLYLSEMNLDEWNKNMNFFIFL